MSKRTTINKNGEKTLAKNIKNKDTWKSKAPFQTGDAIPLSEPNEEDEVFEA